MAKSLLVDTLGRMSRPGADYSWLPDHQLHVAATLAHVDWIIDQAARLMEAYTKAGPLVLGEVVNGDRMELVAREVAPLPAAISRLVADALTQLRAAVEHTLFAEVEHLLDRSMSTAEEKCIEVPAFTTEENFDKWLAHRHRRNLPPLGSGAPLTGCLRRLQPYQHEDTERHPLRVLAEHTNLAKHRVPAVATTRLGAVYPDQPHPDVAVAISPAPGTGRSIALEAGDVLASAPRGQQIVLNVVPTVALQRPHTGEWIVAAKELGLLEQWVRTTAVPTLITGTAHVAPLPPQFDITTGHEDLRQVLAGAGQVAAAGRLAMRIGAAGARGSLVDLIASLRGSPDRDALQGWVDSLDDQAAVARVNRLAENNLVAVVTLLAEAQHYAARR
ncbi:hypothetical protein OHU17_00270 [Streptomyces goshikiensis]|uniref:Uncharacterized protein n=1 Tax=Streptomyces goshikiensis TaxID=1942 RepID=A0ABZ1RCX7_9ACTN|nr:hypothetical protein [Streptomyces goshikiensis]